MRVLQAGDRESSIRSAQSPNCLLCGSEGTFLYTGMKDRISNTFGSWNLKCCANPQCGFVWMDPLPLREDIGKAYEDYFTHTQGTTKNSWIRRLYRRISNSYWSRRYGYEKEERSLLDDVLGATISAFPTRTAYLDAGIGYLNARRPGRVLDIGCGSGALLEKLRELGWQVEGIDFDPIVVQPALAKGLSVHVGTLQEQRFEDETFDAVVMIHVIEHVHDPIELLREVRRILKSGGKLVMLTPNINSIGHKIYREHWLFLDPPRHLQLFSPTTLSALAKLTGFRVSRVLTSGRTAGVMFFGSRWIRRNGRFGMRSYSGKHVKVISEIIEFISWVTTKFIRGSGEELIVIGEKS